MFKDNVASHASAFRLVLSLPLSLLACGEESLKVPAGEAKDDVVHVAFTNFRIVWNKKSAN